MRVFEQRILVPAAIVFMSMLVTLWFSIGLEKNPFQWFPFAVQPNKTDAKPLFELLIALGITNVAIGYICHGLFTFWMMVWPRERFIDVDRLLGAFGLQVKVKCESQRKKIHKEIRPYLLAEFHTRLHSHAPDKLIEHCTHRNTSWYVAKTSAIASYVGCLLAVAIMWSSSANFVAPCLDQVFQQPTTRWGFGIASLMFLVVIPGYLWWQGGEWNREFWHVCWKWIVWDLHTNPMEKPKREEWKASLPQNVVEDLSSFQEQGREQEKKWPWIKILLSVFLVVVGYAPILWLSLPVICRINISNYHRLILPSVCAFALLITVFSGKRIKKRSWQKFLEGLGSKLNYKLPRKTSKGEA
jgi:hypothetical protein